MSGRGARPLTPDQIIGCGLELVDEMGLKGFTTRALAQRLGTYPATLYWHVGNRSQLLAAIVDRALGEVAVEPAGLLDWQEWLRQAALIGCTHELGLACRRGGVACCSEPR